MQRVLFSRALLARSGRVTALPRARVCALGAHAVGRRCASTGCPSRCAAAQYGSSPAAAESGRTATHYSKLGMDGFNDVPFNTAADEFLENVENIVDGLELESVEDINCSGGVLTLETARRGTFLMNKQAPNVQLWLSSPLSGPHHYDMVVLSSSPGAPHTAADEVVWISDHDGHNLKERLEKELTEALGVPIKL